MGKRKERRRAALSTAGRRVKLDLFMEPSGELAGSSMHKNGGGHTDSKHSTGSPEPVSSGQTSKNPLLLLGQYSDDEEDEVSNGSPGLAAVTLSSKDHNDQVIESTYTISDGVASSTAKVSKTDNIVELVPQGDTQADGDNLKTTTTTTTNHIRQSSSPDDQDITGSSDMQVIGDVSSGWKMVMHEATNKCYYWNVETGETSWEVPQVITQADELTTAQKFPGSFGGVNFSNSLETPESGLAMENPDHVSTANEWVQANHSDQMQLVPAFGSSKPYSGYASLFGTSSGDYYSYQQLDGHASDWNSLTTSDGIVGEGVGEHVRVDDLSFRVVKFGEYLLERLKSLKGSLSELNGQDWITAYILEVEFRLSDIKSLLPYGSALLPFWVHSERKLRRLEEAFNNEASQLANANNVDANCIATTFTRSEVCEKIKIVENAAGLPSSDSFNASVDIKSLEVSKTPSADASINVEKNLEDEGTAEHAVIDTDGPNEKLCITCDTTWSPNAHAGDDTDMDVDMEVEEPALPSRIAVVEPAPQGSSLQHMSIVSEHHVSTHPSDEGWIPPPPPDDEMIPPPPPPDNEIFPPPPPPDEPPELAVQPPAYTNPYDAYAECTWYYNQAVAGVQGAEFHGQVEGYQVAVPQASVYYEIPDSYVSSIPVIANSVEPALYYDPQGRQMQPPPVMNGASIELYFDSENKVSSSVEKNGEECVDASPVVAAVQASATVSAQTNISLPSTDIANVAKSTTSKGQFKVSRVKKRTSNLVPSMRSNKKVSCLVDKWKAAKEELQEDEEDEPEDSYEALEKKRQREIEEWRAKQIASGEAKDNANFQPLGGDWRERVKRRRAQLSVDASQTTSDEGNNEKQEPDLIKLAKNLPSGWQVYWDDSSKKVYYGNTNTSETSWIRPTK